MRGQVAIFLLCSTTVETTNSAQPYINRKIHTLSANKPKTVPRFNFKAFPSLYITCTNGCGVRGSRLMYYCLHAFVEKKLFPRGCCVMRGDHRRKAKRRVKLTKVSELEARGRPCCLQATVLPNSFAIRSNAKRFFPQAYVTPHLQNGSACTPRLIGSGRYNCIGTCVQGRAQPKFRIPSSRSDSQDQGK